MNRFLHWSLVAWLLTMALQALPAPEAPARDWRHDLLEDEGIGLDREALTKALGGGPAAPELEAAYRKLGSDDFAEREAAQKELLRGGEATLRWLNQQERSPDPEVRRRVAELRQGLGVAEGQARAEALRHAIQSLLQEGDQPRPDTGGQFYEWFGEPAPKLGKHYRHFQFENSAERGGRVEKGSLLFPGEGGIDADQRLILRSETWPGRAEFGEAFEVSARLGGEDENPVGWHLGISVGNIRALYHPGLQGGAFRFEEIDTNDALTPNVSLDFNPSTDGFQTMHLTVRRLPDGQVLLEVDLREGGGKPGRFKQAITVPANKIGKLDRISLDRSGRNGGTARFKGLTVRLGRAK